MRPGEKIENKELPIGLETWPIFDELISGDEMYRRGCEKLIEIGFTSEDVKSIERLVRSVI